MFHQEFAKTGWISLLSRTETSEELYLRVQDFELWCNWLSTDYLDAAIFPVSTLGLSVCLSHTMQTSNCQRYTIAFSM
jgi:hypothetical protein